MPTRGRQSSGRLSRITAAAAVLVAMSLALLGNAATLPAYGVGLRTPSALANHAIPLAITTVALLLMHAEWIARRGNLSTGAALSTSLLMTVLVVGAALAAAVTSLLILIPVLRPTPFSWSAPALVLALPFLRGANTSGLLRHLARLVHLLTWLHALGFAVVLAFLMSVWTPGALRGEDPMFEERQRIEADGTHYVAVRVNPGAFASFRMTIWRETVLLPGVLSWWSRRIDPVHASDATLRMDGDCLVVRYDDIVGDERRLRVH